MIEETCSSSLKQEPLGGITGGTLRRVEELDSYLATHRVQKGSINLAYTSLAAQTEQSEPTVNSVPNSWVV